VVRNGPHGRRTSAGAFVGQSESCSQWRQKLVMSAAVAASSITRSDASTERAPAASRARCSPTVPSERLACPAPVSHPDSTTSSAARRRRVAASRISPVDTNPPPSRAPAAPPASGRREMPVESRDHREGEAR
jgi:hypothetical protein